MRCLGCDIRPSLGYGIVVPIIRVDSDILIQGEGDVFEGYGIHDRKMGILPNLTDPLIVFKALEWPINISGKETGK